MSAQLSMDLLLSNIVNNYYYLILILFILISFLLRSYLIIKYKWVGKDTFFHLLIGELIRKNKKIPKKHDFFYYPDNYDYPPLFHIFLSKFKREDHYKLQYLAPIIDIIAALVLFYFNLIYFNMTVAIFSMILYLVTPFNYENSFNLSPRSFANTFLIISIYSYFSYYYQHSILALFICLVFMSFTLLTHRLNAQSLIFVMISLSLGLYDLTPILLIIFSIVVNIIITRKFYYKVLLGHIALVKNFFGRALKPLSIKNILKLLPNPVIVLYNIPFIVFIFFPIEVSLQTKFYLIWGISLMIFSLIWITGEGGRHLLNAIPSYATIFTIWAISSGRYDVMISIIGVSILVIISKILRSINNMEMCWVVEKDILDAFLYVNQNKHDNDLLLCLPINYSYAAAYFTGCMLLQSSEGSLEGIKYNYIFFERLKKDDLNDIISEYGVKWLITINQNVDIRVGNILGFTEKNVKVYQMI